jgi:signal transduction histidine kinase
MDRSYLPFPHIFDKIKKNGSMIDWPETCNKCKSSECKEPSTETLMTCSHGYNYRKVNRRLTVAGILVKDNSFVSPAQAKQMKAKKGLLITKEMLDNVVRSVISITENNEEMIDLEKEKILSAYVKREQYKVQFLERIKPEIQKGLSFVHDYKQINSQIIQNVNVLIEMSEDGVDFEDKLQKASEPIKAIYQASKFLEEKLKVAKFLLNPEWLERKDDCGTFRFHGLVLKYKRIYEPRIAEKRLQIHFEGSSYNDVTANGNAVAVIAHTLIDNAVKYSPEDGKVVVRTKDVGAEIEFAVSSFGPMVAKDEMEKIFSPFYRGRSARDVEEEGAGYGLYVSQMIAIRHLETEINSSRIDARCLEKIGIGLHFL